MSVSHWECISWKYYKRSIRIKGTNKMAKNVKCEHWHKMLSPFCIVWHPSPVQFGRLPRRKEVETVQRWNCAFEWGTTRRRRFLKFHVNINQNQDNTQNKDTSGHVTALNEGHKWSITHRWCGHIQNVILKSWKQYLTSTCNKQVGKNTFTIPWLTRWNSFL